MDRRRATCALGLAALGTALPAQAQHTRHGKGKQQERPALAIGAAFAPNGDLWVIGPDEQRRFALRVSGDDGRTWRTARVLDIGQDKVATDGESRPKLLFGPHRWVVIAYTQPLARPYTGEIRMLRSRDGGRTFSAPFTVHRDRQQITHRFESIAFDATGALHTLWIDKRDAEAARAEGKGGRKAYAGAAVYRNVSLDGGATFGPDTRVADHSCECCRIALAPDTNGGVVALWRHVFDKNIRDHAFARIAAGGASATPPVRATFDGWVIYACPHHGPGIAPAAGGGFHAVWFGERGGDTAARYGRLDADGKPVGEPLALPDPFAEHAAVASTRNALAIAWRSYDGTATRIIVLVSYDGGKTFEPREAARTTGESDHPLLVRKRESVYLVWRTERELHVERLIA